MKNILKKMIVAVMVLSMLSMTGLPILDNTVTVQAAVKLSAASLKLKVGQSKQLKVTGTKARVAWKSSNKKVATVTAKGKVTAVAEGTAVISATVNKKAYSCMVLVKYPENPYLSKADFDAKEVAIGDVNIVIPKEWKLSVTEAEDNASIGAFSTSKQPNLMNVYVQKTGEPAPDYKEAKAELESRFSQENIMGGLAETEQGKYVTIEEMKSSDLKTANGTALVAQVKMKYYGTQLNQTAYALMIDNYAIIITYTDAASSDLQKKAEFALNSLRVK
ncbi:MAG TPA: Ig-like domain-containing protein [Clostridiales bacterium]|nr:Ig-like domain-containing protein [Clostridiales bacterium]